MQAVALSCALQRPESAVGAVSAIDRAQPHATGERVQAQRVQASAFSSMRERGTAENYCGLRSSGEMIHDTLRPEDGQADGASHNLGTCSDLTSECSEQKRINMFYTSCLL